MNRFELLPPELVQTIFEYVAHHRSIADRKPVRTSLRSLCLTSKRFYSFAKPLLLENLDLWTSSQVKRFASFAEESRENLELVKRVAIGPFFSDREGLGKVAKSLTRVRDLLLNGKCSLLEPFFGSRITSLTLHLVKLTGSRSIAFPNVKHLALHTDGREGKEGGGDIQPKLELPSLQHLVYLPGSQLDEQYTEAFFANISSTLRSITVPINQVPSLPLSVLENPRISICHTIDLGETIHLGSCLVSNLPTTKRLRISFGRLRSRIDSARMNESTLLLDTWPALLALAEQLDVLILHSPVSGQLAVRDNLLVPLTKLCDERNIRMVREEGKFGHSFWDNVSPHWIKEIEDMSRESS